MRFVFLLQQWYTSTMNLIGTWLTDRMDLQLHVYQLKILIRIVKVRIAATCICKPFSASSIDTDVPKNQQHYKLALCFLAHKTILQLHCKIVWHESHSFSLGVWFHSTFHFVCYILVLGIPFFRMYFCYFTDLSMCFLCNFIVSCGMLVHLMHFH